MEPMLESRTLSAAQRLAYLLFVVLLASSLCFSRPVVSGENIAASADKVRVSAAEVLDAGATLVAE